MTHTLHPQVETLLRRHARELAQISPSENLDARMAELVAGPAGIRRGPARRHFPLPRWAVAAGLATLAILAGVLIGVTLERHAHRSPHMADAWRDPFSPPADFSMWPADSVALQIPVEYSAAGALVAVDPKKSSTGKRYWIDVIVSNDGTLRIEKVVPADVVKSPNQGSRDGITLQTQ
jgi:hypothetical protein